MTRVTSEIDELRAVLADADVLVLPHTANSIGGALAKGDVVVVDGSNDNAVMHSVASKLTELEIRAVSVYIGALQ